MNIFHSLQEKIIQTIIKNSWPKVEIDINFSNKKKNQGEINTTTAMKVASKLKEDTNTIAKIMKDALLEDKNIHSIEIANPGFLNITMKQDFWKKHFSELLLKNNSYLSPNIGNNKTVNIEYVSANPTGPLHIGHLRGAIFGSVLSNTLKKCGFNVVQEFYINDAGEQINKLVETMIIHYKNSILQDNLPLPNDLYQGSYLKDLAPELGKKYGTNLLKEKNTKEIIKDFIIEKMLCIIKNSLSKISVVHDLFVYESDLYKNNQIDKALTILKEKDLIYEGYLTNPKSEDAVSNTITNEKLLLFKSTQFQDDQDRAITKSNGQYSYFGSDIAYTYNKINRNFNEYVLILGADHIGYVSRMHAIFDSLNNEQNNAVFKIHICQLVKYVQNGEIVKMAKRKGNFTTIEDVLKVIPKDVLKYIMVTKKNTTPINFDIQQALEQSKNNPVFYIQYACARAKSLIKKSVNNKKINSKLEIDLTLITHPQEIQLLIKLSEWTCVLQNAAKTQEVHKITTYLYELACAFHVLWESQEENNTNYKFISNDISLTSTRVSLAQTTLYILSEGLSILNMEIVEEM